jgi:anti-sigma factor RsiW
MDAHPSPHPSQEVLQAYGLGKLDDASAEMVHKHLDACLYCRRQVAEVAPDSFLARLRDARAESEESDWRRSTPGGMQTDRGQAAEPPISAPEPVAVSRGAADDPTIGPPPRPSGPQPETGVTEGSTLDPLTPGASP